MILQEKVEINIMWNNKDYLISKGYINANYQWSKNKSKIFIKVEDLRSNDYKHTFLCKCERCGKEVYMSMYSYNELCIDCRREIRSLPKCLDCGKQLSRRETKYCMRCVGKHRRGKNNPMYGKGMKKDKNPTWKGGKPKCVDCGKQLSNYNNIRCRSCWAIFERGSNHPSWKSDWTDEDRKLSQNRTSGCHGIGSWKKLIKKKDKNTCQICFRNNLKTKIVVHHKDSYADNPDKRTDINNGIVLCEDCHKEFHHIYGTRHNTRKQLDQFVELKIIHLLFKLYSSLLIKGVLKWK
jgi:hypothetical protein